MNQNLEQQVLAALSEIQDPDLHQDIVSLGFIKDLVIKNQEVSFKIELTTPACPVKEDFRHQAKQLVGKIPGVQSVQVEMSAQKKSFARQENPDHSGLAKVNSIVAIASCKGGVGKSTVSAMVACEIASKGFRVGLLDLDIFGPSVPTLFNLHPKGVRSKDQKMLPLIGHHEMKLMSFGFLLGDSPAIMRGAMVSNYISQFLFKVDWGELDYLFIDLPPGTGDTQLTLSQSVPLDGAVMVTTHQALSLVDVARGILMFEKVKVPLLGIVENMAYFNCGKCGEKHFPFGDRNRSLSERFGLESIISLPFLKPKEINYSTYRSFPLAEDLAEKLIRSLGKHKKQMRLPEIDSQEGMIRLTWFDHQKTMIKSYGIDYHTLRVHCRCAICQDEYTGEKKLDPQQVDANVYPEEITPLGHYALSIRWSDGHDSGIYSYHLIESLIKQLKEKDETS